MTKFRLQISVLVFLLLGIHSAAQQNYTLHLRGVDKDSAFLVSQLWLTTGFSSRFACAEYINKLHARLQGKGYVTASFDTLRYDSSFAKLVLYLWR